MTRPPARADEDPASPRHEVVWPGRPGVLQTVDVPRLVQAAEDARVTIELPRVSGETLFEGTAVAIVHGPADAGLDSGILAALGVGPERSFEQDPGFALRVLVDIALRGLSPALNDPTTAVQALDAIEGLLRVLAHRRMGPSPICGADGELRVVLVLPTWSRQVGLALDEIIEMAPTSVQVQRRLERLLEDVAAAAAPERRAPLETRLAQVRKRVNAGPRIEG